MSETRQSNDRDERIKSMSSWRKALIRPELGGICGTIRVFIFFMSPSNIRGGVTNFNSDCFFRCAAKFKVFVIFSSPLL